MVTVSSVKARKAKAATQPREIGVVDSIDFKKIWSEAAEASRLAYINNQHLDGTFPCGISWITIPNRGKFAAWLLQNDLARKNSYSPGLTLLALSRNNFAPPTQSYTLNAKVDGAVVTVLRNYGIDAKLEIRVD